VRQRLLTADRADGRGSIGYNPGLLPARRRGAFGVERLHPRASARSAV
ncbi:MAG: hypothetical protein AVDCRST_MAG11-4130, partial [uncultured Gemmatimonadaceae bacterium]